MKIENCGIDDDAELNQAFVGLQQVADSIMAEFTLNRSIQDFKELSKNIGESIRVVYLRSSKVANDKLSSEGVLFKVYPFKGITLVGGTFIPFLDEQKAIQTIHKKNGNQLSTIYDRSHILHSKIKLSNRELLSTYKLNVFGVVNPEIEAKKWTQF